MFDAKCPNLILNYDYAIATIPPSIQITTYFIINMAELFLFHRFLLLTSPGVMQLETFRRSCTYSIQFELADLVELDAALPIMVDQD